jgi:hypothetical protein
MHVFMPQNRPMAEKYGLTVCTMSSGRHILAHMWMGGRVEAGVGGKPLYLRKSIHGKNAAVYSRIVSLTDL